MKNVFISLLIIFLHCTFLEAQVGCGFPSIVIQNASQLEILTGDPDFCDTIDVPIEITNVVDLTPLNFIKKARSIRITINEGNLKHLVGLDSLEEVASIDITSLFGKDLESINAFGALRKLDRLTISSNPSLVHIEAMPLIDSLFFFEFRSNPMMAALDFLPNLKSCNHLGVSLNEALGSLSFDRNLSSSTLIEISSCPKLTEIYLPSTSEDMTAINLSLLEKLETIHVNDNAAKRINSFYINELPSLKNFKGLDSLEKVAAFFAFWGCESLTSIGNYPRLDTIGMLGLGQNDILEDISGLSNLEYIADQLYISESINLSMCNLRSFCEFAARDTAATTVFDNGSGCATAAEIISSCALTNTVDDVGPRILVVYPNPVSDVLTIETPKSARGKKFEIIDSLGKVHRIGRVDDLPLHEDISELASGLYFVRLDVFSQVILKL